MYVPTRLDVDGEPVDITIESVLVQRQEKENLKVLNEGSLTVALDPEITEELLQEGLVRDLIRAVQNLRKERGFEVTDRITLAIDGSEEILAAVRSFEDYLRGETLTDDLRFTVDGDAQEISIGDFRVAVDVQKNS